MMPITITHWLIAQSMLVSAYWVCFIVGGGLMLLTLLGSDAADGGADLDADFDIDADVDVDADVADGADSLLGFSTWFSMRFLVYAVACFGAVGVVLTHIVGASPRLTLVAAIVSGIIIGQAVHQLFRSLNRSSSDSSTQPQDYVQKLARVTIGIEPGRIGEVALYVRGSQRYVPARATGETQEFKIGDEVMVVAYRGGVAGVASRDEYEESVRGREARR